MIGFKPVNVSRGGFRFCRYSMAVAMWVGVLWRLPELLAACALIMAANALLTVRRAPLVVLYAATLDRLHDSGTDVIDENGIRLAHIVATFAIGVPLALAHWGTAGQAEFAWRFLIFVAAFKTVGALGYCPVSRMFTCMIGGGSCCRFLKFRSRA